MRLDWTSDGLVKTLGSGVAYMADFKACYEFYSTRREAIIDLRKKCQWYLDHGIYRKVAIVKRLQSMVALCDAELAHLGEIKSDGGKNPK